MRVERNINRMSFTTPIQQFKKPKMEESEVRDRLERIKRYNEYHLRAGQEHHCLLLGQLETHLVDWGHNPKRAKGVGHEPKETALMKAHRENQAATGAEF